MFLFFFYFMLHLVSTLYLTLAGGRRALCTSKFVLSLIWCICVYIFIFVGFSVFALDCSVFFFCFEPP